MRKVLLGTALAAGLMATSVAQADTEDALLGGLIGVAVGVSLANDHDHGRVVHHHHQPRPVHYSHHAPPRHVHHHPRGHAYGYWRKHDGHNNGHHNRFSHNDRRDWGRRDGHHDGRRGWDRRDGRRDGQHDGRHDRGGRDGRSGHDRD